MRLARLFRCVPVPVLLGWSLLSCGDAPLPAAEGAAAIHYALASTGSKTPVCRPQPHWSNYPVAPLDSQVVTASEITDKAIDGSPGNMVHCRISLQGDRYAVSAEIRSAGMDPTIGSFTADLAFSLLIGENEAGIRGTVYASDLATGQTTFTSDIDLYPPKPGCLFSVVPQANEKLGVGPGHIWARVSCPHLSDWRNQANEECAIDDGYVFFEHCSQ
jgi:hypothetical protein